MSAGRTPAVQLICGLGNPGAEYDATRHNVGRMAVARWAQQLGGRFRRAAFPARVCAVDYAGNRLFLLEPAAYMNESGGAVRAAVDYYEVRDDAILIVHDDLDLPLGVLRLKRGGSSGGHKGIQSILQHLETAQFQRLKIGIGRPPGAGSVAGTATGSMARSVVETVTAADYVLARFAGSEQTAVDAMLQRAVQAMELWSAQGIDEVMRLYN